MRKLKQCRRITGVTSFICAKCNVVSSAYHTYHRVEGKGYCEKHCPVHRGKKRGKKAKHEA